MESYLNDGLDREIYDEEMLNIFQKFIQKNGKDDLFIVLHQKGSHGPAYYKRTPNNYINGIYQNIILLLPEQSVKSISSKANKNQAWQHHLRKTIFVFVIGEAARASNFSLNGYVKETNPNLKKHDIINFGNFYSCGTTTAVSVPCIFSSLNKSNFSKAKFKNNDNLLKLIKNSGFNSRKNFPKKAVIDPRLSTTARVLMLSVSHSLSRSFTKITSQATAPTNSAPTTIVASFGR